MINSIPNHGEPEAAEMFAKAESTLGAAKRHLGDELHDKYRVPGRYETGIHRLIASGGYALPPEEVLCA